MWVEDEGVVQKKGFVTYIRMGGREVLVSWCTAVRVTRLDKTQAIVGIEVM
jgi:hypothetical protein